MSLHNKYIVLTGDLKASRKIKEREKIQENFKVALEKVNESFKEAIVARFIIIGGDSFQGMLSSPLPIFDIYYELFDNISYPFYLGIGIGSISTKLSKNVGEMDGEAFYKAGEALEKVKKKGTWISFRSGWEIDAIVTASWNLMADVMWRWSERQKEIIMYYRRHGENRDAIEKATKNFGVTDKNIYKILRRGRYHLLKEVESALNSLINQKWLNKKIKPDTVEKR